MYSLSKQRSSSSSWPSSETTILPTRDSWRRPRRQAWRAGSAPHNNAIPRSTHAALRWTSIVLSILLCALAGVSCADIDRAIWSGPILSPAINSFFVGGREIWMATRNNQRAHRLYRLLHELALAVGYAIASGFLVSMTLPDITRRRPTSTASTAAVGYFALLAMFSEMYVNRCFSSGCALPC